MTTRKSFAIVGLTLAFALSLITGIKADVIHVFLFAGQSNMWGYAPTVQLAPVPIWAQNAPNGWEGHPFWSSDDQVMYPRPDAAGYNIALNNTYDAVGAVKAFGSDGTFGPEISLTELIQNTFPTWKIAVVKCAVGGTSIAVDWNPSLASTGNTYSMFIQHVQAMDADIRASGNIPVYEGLLWWQGENGIKTYDYLNPVPAFGQPLDPVHGQRYEDYVYRFLLAVRSTIAPNLPTVIFRISNSMLASNIITPQVVPNNALFTYAVLQAAAVNRRTEQVLVANTVPHCTWVNTDNLPVDQTGNSAFWYHFIGDGYLAAGERGFAALQALKGWQPGNANAAPANLSAAPESDAVLLTWDGTSSTYNVGRSLTSGGPYVTIASGLNVPIYNDVTAQNGVTYYYVVTGVNNVVAAATSLQTPNSNEASVTPEPNLTSLTVSPSTVIGGASTTGSVTLDTPAPNGGTTVSLSSSNTAVVSVPVSVTVPAGQTSASFTLSAPSLALSSSALVSAVFMGETQTAALTVQATPGQVPLQSLSIGAASTTGGGSVTGTVTLTSAAPAGGETISLSSNTPAVANVPSSVTVAAGQSRATFTITTSPVAVYTNVTFSASYTDSTQTATLQVRSPYLSNVTASPTKVIGGTSTTGTIVLSGPAPVGGITLSMGSANASVASVPASFTVPAGQSSATFTITTYAVTSSTTVAVGATIPSSGSAKSVSVTVNP